MRIALHDADAQHLSSKSKFPNYALMKISAYHKSIGDTVEWFMPLYRDLYDKIYSSKVFDFTPEDPFLPENAIKGGTGYGFFEELPSEIDRMFPDYSIYPDCDYAIGFLTRGCPNKCANCYVPQKEGDIRPYNRWQDIVRNDTKKLVLMDNNITAHPLGIQQLKELAGTEYEIDINQATSAFTITEEVAEIFSHLKWIKFIRLACDRKSQINAVLNAAHILKDKGIPNSKLFIYVLITKDLQDNLERIYAMRNLRSATIYGMPYKDMRIGEMPEHWQMVMAQKYIYSGQWRKIDWMQWEKEHKFYFAR